jgi:insulin-like growth factor 2 mRNA-binding protein 1
MENSENGNNNNNGGNRSTKVFIRQLPTDVDWSEFEKTAGEFGEVVSCNQGGTAEAPTAIITYKTAEEAAEAAEKLDKKEIKGNAIKATIYVERGRNNRRNIGGIGIGSTGGHHRPGYANAMASVGGDLMHRQLNNSASAGLPLRMVVGARFVGAIIGQGGANIREITRDSKARCVVDVSRGLRDQAGNVEKVINIYGTPESCSKACMKILEVVQREAAKDPANQGKTIEPELKLRAHNSLVGRLIGKGGATIKKIMEETGCTIFVSNIGELTAFNMERTITVRGNLEHVAQAESKISSKLRQCWENDAANAPSAIYGGVHPQMLVPQMGGPMDPYCYQALPGPPAFVPPVPQVGPGRHPGVAPMHAVAAAAAAQSQTGAAAAFAPVAAAAAQGIHQSTGGLVEVVHIWVPNNIVGALIGTKGVHIRNIMRLTGAHIRIESTKNEAGASGDQAQQPTQQQQTGEKEDEAAQNQQSQPQQPNQGSTGGQGSDRHQSETERRVTITGSDQQQYKAQIWIFQRVCEHTHQFFDEVRLWTEIQVPSKLVGRIIGKGGQNVRELQRVTGAQVKIPEDAATQEENEDTLVRIIGNFNASQAVQARVRQLVLQFHSQQGQSQQQPRSLSGERSQRANNTRGVVVNHHSESQE